MLLILTLAQGIRYFLLLAPPAAPEFVLQENQSAIRWLDSLKTSEVTNQITYRYNPNFLSDYQGYMLGMTPEEIDRIFAHRAAGNWINSEAEFWSVSKIIDARRTNIASRLRFGEKGENVPRAKRYLPDQKTEMRDINKATAEELMEIRGIGSVLSQRIIKFRDRLGGFLVKEQLYDVYGLDREIVDRGFMNYAILQKPEIIHININEATFEEIASLVYLSRQVAYRIVRYREQHGPFENLEELTKIEDFPADKIERIRLYLSL